MPRRYLVVLIISLLHSLRVFAADDTTRVLFIGNSFTYRYDIPWMVKQMAESAGLPVVCSMHAISSMSVGNKTHGMLAHMYNPVVFGLIRSHKWDYVSVQDDQGNFMLGDGVFPSPITSKVIEGHLKIRDSVMACNPCAHMLWYAGWALKNGYGSVPTGKGLIDIIYANYKHLRDTAGGIVSPVGKAWIRAMDAMPGLDLWDPDNLHQTGEGAYLSAAVFFTTIFRVQPHRVTYTAGLDSATTAMLRQVAYQVVLDSAVQTSLQTIVPVLAVTDTQITAPASFASYTWRRNESALADTTGFAYRVATGGYYQVVCTGNEACSYRSWEKYAAGHTVPAEAGRLLLYPNPAQTEVSIETPTSDDGKITICNIAGQILREANTTGRITSISVAGLPPGLYIATLRSGKGIYNARFTKEEK